MNIYIYNEHLYEHIYEHLYERHYEHLYEHIVSSWRSHRNTKYEIRYTLYEIRNTKYLFVVIVFF